MKQGICDASQPCTPLGQVPDEIAEAARALRTAFGPSVRLLRVTGSVDLGNPAWDWYCREVDGENDNKPGERNDD